MRRVLRPSSVALLAAAAVCLLSASPRGQAAGAADPFAPVAFLIGRWNGTIEGQPGRGAGQREYCRVLNDRFIRVTNRSQYAPQEKNPKGEVHEDEGFISFDRARKVLVLRQFHVEGFVNVYVQDATSTADRLVFTSESIENIPAGFKARETYRRTGADTFEETFEMAEPGKAFEVYSRTQFTRAR